MPDPPISKWHSHPVAAGGGAEGVATPSLWPYAELHCKTNFSFLRGASHPEELVERAAMLGYRAIAVTDRNSLAGAVRMHIAAKRAGLKLLVGAEIVPVDGPPVVLLATDRKAYGRLSRLITAGRRRAIKGDCGITFDDIAQHAGGLIAVCLPHFEGENQDGLAAYLRHYRELFAGRAYLAAELCYGDDDRRWLAELGELSRRAGLPLVASNDVHYHDESRRRLHDILTCIRHRCSIHAAGRRVLANARRHLIEPDDLVRRYAACAGAIERTVEIAERCAFSMDELRYEYPHEICPEGVSPTEYLAQLTWDGAGRRYDGRVPPDVRGRIEHELAIISKLRYEPYFLTVWDVVRFARNRDILCQGRGSAANSTVCYCLGVTAVDPTKIDLLFERFISEERNEPPDIDVDFEHERREEVFQYIYGKYGRERAAITAEVITYRPRSAVRDVGKALGLSLDCVDALAKRLDWWERRALPDDVVREAGMRPGDPTLKMLTELVNELVGFPRHLGQHVGGFVMTEGPLCETVPIENAAMPDRTFVEWDKDDLDALGMLKVDCLSLGMLTCIHKAFRFVDPKLALHNLPSEDKAVYDMICHADTVGVFQIESRAQMSMLPRLRPQNFYDLVIEVAIVRPGPIQGGMVHPFLRRRNGEEKVKYPSPEVEGVLKKTLGVPLFQEQAMKLAVVAAGFSPGEADRLRRAMAAWKRHGGLDHFHDRFVEGMKANGYKLDFAERCFNQLRGFGEYGFPESHAASFALLVYVSAWLKRYHPAAFAAALINSQPMGFYAPAQIVRDAQNHGVTVLRPDVNASDYDCTLEGEGRREELSDDPSTWGWAGPAIRLGYRLIRGISEQKVAGIVAARRERAFRSVADVFHRVGVARETMARLAAADVFRSLGLNRREALWQVLALHDEPGLFDGTEPVEAQPTLPMAELSEQVVADYDTLGLSLTAHPMSLVRDDLRRIGVSENRDLRGTQAGRRIAVSGIVLVRQRPGTAKGVVFMTLEDETATANLIIRPQVWERWRASARRSVAVVAEGTVERQGEVIHVMVQRFDDLSERMGALSGQSRDFH